MTSCGARIDDARAVLPKGRHVGMENPSLTFCFCGNGAVVLDLPRNRYFGLGHLAAARLRAAMTSEITASETPASPELVDRILAQRSPGACVLDPVASRSILPLRSMSVRIVDRVRVGVALIEAGFVLKLRSMQGLVDWLRRTKRRHHRRAARFDETDQVQMATRLTAACEAWFRIIGREGNCLLRASALARAMARSGLEPTFVVGVAQYPFEAHSWVQLGSNLVSDQLEGIAAYTPVLVV